MQITSTPSAMADLLAPTAAPAEPRTSTEPGTSSADAAAAFTAMLSAMMGAAAPAPTAAQPTADGETADAATVEREEETLLESSPAATDATPTIAQPLDARPMDALLYGLRTDAQLGRLADELGNGAAARPQDDEASAGRGGSAVAGAMRAAERQAAREPAHGTPIEPGTGPVASDAARAHADAHSAAAPTAATAPTNGSGATDRVPAPAHDVTALDPELQERLTRIVDRMRDEFGYDVEIVETTRSQARQDQLFAQGRTRPGPVVTWTRSSQHTLGRAVDVNIDGSWENTEAFQLLQRIAREEGLRTLGPRDAGHLELARNAAKAHETADAPAALPDGEALPARAPSAQPHASAQGTVHAAPDGAVAQVAAVAVVAEVAQVAAVAQPGAAPVQAAGQSAESHAARVARGPRPGTPAAARRESRDEEARTEGEPLPGLAAATLASAQSSARVPESAAPTLGAAAVERLTRVTDRIEAGAAGRNLSHITLRIDNAAGGQDQIRIDLRGLTVDTQIAVADAGTAERMADRMGELRDALGRQGLSADTVTISAAGARAADTATATPSDAGRAAAIAAAGAAQDAGASSSSSQQSSSQQQKQEHDPTPRDAARDTTRDAQQHGSRDGRRGRDAEPWFTDDAPAAGRVRGRTR